MPTLYTNDVDLYCTHDELVGEVGGDRKLRKLVPPDAEEQDPTRDVREQALRDVMKVLRRRSPPVHESQITIPAELKDAVAYGALMRLYRAAMTTPDDVNAALYRDYKKKFEDEVGNLRLSVDGTTTVDIGPVTVFRR